MAEEPGKDSGIHDLRDNELRKKSKEELIAEFHRIQREFPAQNEPSESEKPPVTQPAEGTSVSRKEPSSESPKRAEEEPVLLLTDVVPPEEDADHSSNSHASGATIPEAGGDQVEERQEPSSLSERLDLPSLYTRPNHDPVTDPPDPPASYTEPHPETAEDTMAEVREEVIEARPFTFGDFAGTLMVIVALALTLIGVVYYLATEWLPLGINFDREAAARQIPPIAIPILLMGFWVTAQRACSHLQVRYGRLGDALWYVDLVESFLFFLFLLATFVQAYLRGRDTLVLIVLGTFAGVALGDALMSGRRRFEPGGGVVSAVADDPNAPRIPVPVIGEAVVVLRNSRGQEVWLRSSPRVSARVADELQRSGFATSEPPTGITYRPE